MSISDTSQAMINGAREVEAETRWFLAALPQVVSTEKLYHKHRLGGVQIQYKLAFAWKGRII